LAVIVDFAGVRHGPKFGYLPNDASFKWVRIYRGQ